MHSSAAGGMSAARERKRHDRGDGYRGADGCDAPYDAFACPLIGEVEAGVGFRVQCISPD